MYIKFAMNVFCPCCISACHGKSSMTERLAYTCISVAFHVAPVLNYCLTAQGIIEIMQRDSHRGTCMILKTATRIWLNLHVLFVAVFFGKKTQKNTNIKCNVIKSTIYIQGELD